MKEAYQPPQTELLDSNSEVGIPYFFVAFHVILFVLAFTFFGFLVPRFSKLFQEFGIELPAITKGLLSFTRVGWPGLLVMFGVIQGFVIGGAIGLANLPGGGRFLRPWKIIANVLWILLIGFTMLSVLTPFVAIWNGLSSK